jgi:hypothetical protein
VEWVLHNLIFALSRAEPHLGKNLIAAAACCMNREREAGKLTNTMFRWHARALES